VWNHSNLAKKGFQLDSSMWRCLSKAKVTIPRRPCSNNGQPDEAILLGNQYLSFCIRHCPNAERWQWTPSPLWISSRTFSPTEQRYQIYDHELFALIWALVEWKVYLEGTLHLVTFFTDHNNRQYFLWEQTLNNWQAQWSLFLSQFPFQLVHKPGKKKILSDSLSRRLTQKNSKRRSDRNPPS
jgi:hypothetical protein